MDRSIEFHEFKCKYFYDWDNYIPCCKLIDSKKNTKFSKCKKMQGKKCKDYKEER